MFPLLGREIPVDHGYPLYSALGAALPTIHTSDRLCGVGPVRGRYVGNGILSLLPGSRLRLLIEPEGIGSLLRLTGKKLVVSSRAIRLGVPTIEAIRPAESLYAHVVTIKGYLDVEEFRHAVERQLIALGITSGSVMIGERKTFCVSGRQIVGFRVYITGLRDEDSVVVQERGIGGRRRMGCGLFVPRKDVEA